MSENNEKNLDKTEDKKKDFSKEKKVELTVDQKLKDTEDKLLRSLAEIENQRRRFEKEIKDAFEFGSFNFAKESLAILDNLQRAKIAIKNDEKLKKNEDLNKFLDNINIIEKDLTSIFEKKFALSLEFETKVFPVSFGLGILRFIGLILRNFLDIKNDISLNFPLLWVPINIFFIST